MHFIHWLNHTPSDIQASELIIRGEDWWMGQLVRGRLGRWRESCYSVSDAAAAGHWAVTWPLSFPAGRQVCWQSRINLAELLPFNDEHCLCTLESALILIEYGRKYHSCSTREAKLELQQIELTQLTKNQWCRVLLTLSLLCHWVTVFVLSVNSL